LREEGKKKRIEKKKKTKKGNKKIRNKTEPSRNKNRTEMELEIDNDSDFDFDIPIPKKSQNRPSPNQGTLGNNPQTLKRQNPSQTIEIFDFERDDLKKSEKIPYYNSSREPECRKTYDRKKVSDEICYLLS